MVGFGRVLLFAGLRREVNEALLRGRIWLKQFLCVVVFDGTVLRF